MPSHRGLASNPWCTYILEYDRAIKNDNYGSYVKTWLSTYMQNSRKRAKEYIFFDDNYTEHM